MPKVSSIVGGASPTSSVMQTQANGGRFSFEHAGGPRVPDVPHRNQPTGRLAAMKLFVTDRPKYLAEKAARCELELEAAVLASARPLSARDSAMLQDLAKRAIAVHADLSELEGTGFNKKTMHLERCIAIHQSVRWPAGQAHAGMAKIGGVLMDLYGGMVQRNSRDHLNLVRSVQAGQMTQVFNHGRGDGPSRNESDKLAAFVQHLPRPTPNTYFEDLTVAEKSTLLKGESPWPHVPGIDSFVQEARTFVRTIEAPAVVSAGLPSKGEKAFGNPQLFAKLIAEMAFPDGAQDDDVPPPPPDDMAA